MIRKKLGSMLEPWDVRDRDGEILKRGDYVMLDGELVKITYITRSKMIVRRDGELEHLKPRLYKGRLSNVEKVYSSVSTHREGLTA